MDSKIIFNKLSVRFPDLEKFPLLIAMLEECCEHAAKSDTSDDNKEAVALIALQTSLSILGGVLEAGFEKVDTITLNYRNQTFHLNPESPFVKAFSQLSLK